MVPIHDDAVLAVQSDGDFFGEMALLDRSPRNATVITTQPCTLLVLYASDFYSIASRMPSLVAAMEKEAHRRRLENEARAAAEAGLD